MLSFDALTVFLGRITQQSSSHVGAGEARWSLGNVVDGQAGGRTPVLTVPNTFRNGVVLGIERESGEYSSLHFLGCIGVRKIDLIR